MKRFMTMILSAILVLSVSAFSSAEQTITGTDNSGKVNLTYVIDANFIFTIPDSNLTFRSDGIMLPLTLSGNIDSIQVDVSTDHNFNLVNTEVTSSSIGYRLINGEKDVQQNPTITVNKGTTTYLMVDIIDSNLIDAKAGSYTDGITFTVQY